LRLDRVARGHGQQVAHAHRGEILADALGQQVGEERYDLVIHGQPALVHGEPAGS